MKTKTSKLGLAALLLIALSAEAQPTEKPPLHGNHWMAVTGKPLAAEAGAVAGLTRERVRQIEKNLLQAVAAVLEWFKVERTEWYVRLARKESISDLAVLSVHVNSRRCCYRFRETFSRYFVVLLDSPRH